MVRQIILTGFVVFLPAGAQAQGRGGMPQVSHAVGVAPRVVRPAPHAGIAQAMPGTRTVARGGAVPNLRHPDRKGTRLNSRHGYISYSVFCFEKKKNTV